MPYRPLATTEVGRNYAYKSVWASAACAVAVLPLYLSGFDGVIYGWIFGGAAGGVLASIVTGRTDDYFRSLGGAGHRWVMFALFAYLILGWLAIVTGRAVPTENYGILGGSPRESGNAAVSLFFDGHLAAIILAIVYHTGYGYQWLRDRVGSEGKA